MENILKRYFKGDYVIWVIYILLVMVSILALYSASSPLIVDGPSDFIKHIIFLIAGFVILILVYLSPRNYVKFAAWGLLVFAFIMQIVAYIPSISADHRRISFFGIFDIQPSEIIKFALIVITAYFIDRFQNSDFLQKNFKLFFAIIWLPLLFIIPSNLSTGIIIILPIGLMMMIGSIPWKKIGYFIGIPALIFFAIFSIALIVPAETYEKYNDTRTEMSATKVAVKVLSVTRAHTWKNRFGAWNAEDRTQEEIRQDEQAERSKCAIYDGRDPKLPGNSFWRNHIPQGYSDFIFSIIVEEYGIYGAILVILLFVWLLWRAGVLVKKCETVYSAIVIVGVATVIVFQAFVHISVCTGLFPVTGQTLPLISKGGTSILVMSAFFGLLLRMSCEVEEIMIKSQESRAKSQDEETVAERSRSTENDVAKNKISEEKSDEILENKNEIIEEISDIIIEIPEDEIAETTEIEIN